MIRILPSAAALLVLCASPSHAGTGLEVAVPSIFSFLTAATIAIEIATPIVQAALVIGATWAAQQLFGPKGGTANTGATAAINPSSARATFETSESPEMRAVGRVRLGGLKAFGRTRAENRFRLIVHTKGEIDGLEEVYLGEREVVLASNGAVSSFPWDNGDIWAYVKTKNGTDSETAWSDLVSAFPGVWTADHRCRGLAQSLMQFVSPGLDDPLFLSLYQGGVPDLEVVIRAEKNVYDPRISASQWTENGILNAQHILLSYPERQLSDFDLSFIEAEADRADALIETRAGSVPRARCCGVWSSETARGDNMQKVLDSIGAWIVPRDGGEKIGLQLIDDVYDEAEVAIPLRHITSISWRPGPEGVERPNLCRLKYYSPERNYDMGEVDLSTVAWARIDDEIAAYGEKPLDIDLTFCPNAGQAQRRARQMFALARADSGIVRTNLAGLAVWGCKIVDFEMPDDLPVMRTVIGAPRILDDEGQVEIPFVVWPDLEEWDPDVHEADAPEQLPDIPYGDQLETPATPSAATVVTYPVGGSVTRVAYTLPGDATGAEATYRVYADGKPSAWRPMTEYEASGFHHAYVPVDESGENADFRLRTFDSDNENGSIWSDTLNVASLAVDNTAPDEPTWQGEWDSMTVSVFTLNPVAPSNLNVAYLSLTGADAPVDANNAIRPGEPVEWTTGSDGTFTASARATDGTSSATLTVITDRDLVSAGCIAATHHVGTNSILIKWIANDPTTAQVTFTGGNAPASMPAIPGQSGQWTDSPVGSGTHNYSITVLDNLSNVLGTATASITI